MKTLLSLLFVGATSLLPMQAFAQVAADCGCAVAEYRLQPQTIYEERPVTTYRPVQETTYEERAITTMRPVWETSYRERRYQVAKPVQETSYREERYTVLRPVRETYYRDASYDRVRYITETSTRLERHTVQRPVVETQTRQEQFVVQRPVVETTFQDQVATNMVPVTTYRQQVVDNGQFVDQLAYVPGPVRNRLRWLSPQCAVDPVTGQNYVQRAGLHWVPIQRPGTYQVQRAYVPNPTVQQIAETQMVPQQVVQRVPVQVTRMQQEVQTREVPVQVMRMQTEEEFREVPVSVQRPVVERIENKIPVEVLRYVPEEVVRQVPVTTMRMTYEDRVEQIPVRTCRMVADTKVVQIPRTTCRMVAETSMRQFARTVLMRVPIDPCTGADLVSPAPAHGTSPADAAPVLEGTWRDAGPSRTTQKAETPSDDLEPTPAEPPKTKRDSEPSPSDLSVEDGEWQGAGGDRATRVRKPELDPRLLQDQNDGSRRESVLQLAPAA